MALARTAYDELTDIQKGFVTNYSDLVKAEEKIVASSMTYVNTSENIFTIPITSMLSNETSYTLHGIDVTDTIISSINVDVQTGELNITLNNQLDSGDNGRYPYTIWLEDANNQVIEFFNVEVAVNIPAVAHAESIYYYNAHASYPYIVSTTQVDVANGIYTVEGIPTNDTIIKNATVGADGLVLEFNQV